MFDKFNHIRDRYKLNLSDIKQYWLHAILGFVAIFEGLNLLFDNNYFLYPPYLREEMNSDIVGAFAIVTGILIIMWCISKNHTGSWNRNALALACAFFMFETIAETIQIFAPEHNPHVIIAGGVNLALFCIALSLENVDSNK